jgi:hypothetical protein
MKNVAWHPVAMAKRLAAFNNILLPLRAYRKRNGKVKGRAFTITAELASLQDREKKAKNKTRSRRISVTFTLTLPLHNKVWSW